jgi:hypothetical protein
MNHIRRLLRGLGRVAVICSIIGLGFGMVVIMTMYS